MDQVPWITTATANSTRSPFRRGRGASWPALLGGGLLLIAACLSGPGLAQESAPKQEGAAPRTIPEGLRFAHGLFRQRKFDLAADEYQQFLETNPQAADADDARFGLASARLFQGRYKESREAFQDFLEKAPNHPRAVTAWYRLGELSYMLGDLPEARTALETFVAKAVKHPNLETAWTYLGDIRLKLDDLAAARKAYERSLADFPQGQLLDRSRYGLGRALAGLNEVDEAIKVFTELATHGTSDWVDRAWFQTARLQVEHGRNADAIESLDALDRDAPRSGLKAEAALLRSEVLIKLGKGADAEPFLKSLITDGTEPLASRAALSLATIQIERDDAEGALATLDAALEHSSRSPLVPAFLFRSAEALVKLKRPDEARKRFLEAAEADPKDAWADDAVARAARIASEQKDDAAAFELAEAFPTRFPQSSLKTEVSLIAAHAAIALKKPERVVEILEPLVGASDATNTAPKSDATALPKESSNAARLDLALAYRSLGQADKADALLAGLAATAPNGEGVPSQAGANAQFLLGQEQVEKGNYAEAIGPLEQYLDANPLGDVADHARAHLVAAQVGLKKLEDAEKALTQFAEDFPRSELLPLARLRVAELALDTDHPDKAVEQFEAFLKPSPDAKPLDPALQARAQGGLARSLWKAGKPAEAAEAFDRLLQLAGDAPNAPAVALDRAGALVAAGQIEPAITAYKDVSDRYPKSPQAIDADLARVRLLAKSGKAEAASALLDTLLAHKDRFAAIESTGVRRDALIAEQALLLADAGKFPESDAIFSALLKEFPESPHALEARFHLAESASASGNRDEVIRLLEPIMAAAPGKSEGEIADRLMPLVLYRLGRTQIEAEKWADAETTLGRLVDSYPKSDKARLARFLQAEAALHLNHGELAETLLATLDAEPAPTDDEGKKFAAIVKSRRVQSLVAIKKWDEALKRAEAFKGELPANDPMIAELDFARGRSLLGLGRPDDARAAFQAVIDAVKGGDLAAHAQLMRGETFFHQERFREALREFLQVDFWYESPQWQAAALLEAGKTYERLTQWSDAVETYEQLLKRDPNEPIAAEAKARLDAARKHETPRAAAPGE